VKLEAAKLAQRNRKAAEQQAILDMANKAKAIPDPQAPEVAE
jgi:hypothetical protein